MAEWITLEVFPSRHVAEMMRELLVNEGIPAMVSADDAGGLRPELAYTLGARLRVAPENEARARWVLEHFTGTDDGDDDEEPDPKP